MWEVAEYMEHIRKKLNTARLFIILQLWTLCVHEETLLLSLPHSTKIQWNIQMFKQVENYYYWHKWTFLQARHRTKWIVWIQRSSEAHIIVDDQGKDINIQKLLSTCGMLNWSVKFKWLLFHSKYLVLIQVSQNPHSMTVDARCAALQGDEWNCKAIQNVKKHHLLRFEVQFEKFQANTELRSIVTRGFRCVKLLCMCAHPHTCLCPFE